MIDISKAKWELSKEEQLIFKWLEDNGYDAVLDKQFVNKIYVSVTKDGLTDNAQFLCGFKYDVKGYMEQYGKSFDLLKRLEILD